MQHFNIEGERGMGLRPWDVEEGQTEGQRNVLRRANEILGFAQRVYYISNICACCMKFIHSTRESEMPRHVRQG